MDKTKIEAHRLGMVMLQLKPLQIGEIIYIKRSDNRIRKATITNITNEVIQCSGFDLDLLGRNSATRLFTSIGVSWWRNKPDG